MFKNIIQIMTIASLLSMTVAQSKDIVVAVAGTMTGSYASFGEQYKRGAEQFVKDINAVGGVLGRKLRLEIGDSRCDPKEAVSVANKLANDGVVLVVGHFCSSAAIPASAVYYEEGVINIAPSATNPKLTEQGFGNVFRVCGRDDQQGPFAGKYLVKHYLHQRVAFVHDRQAYGKGLVDQARITFEKAGGKPAFVGTVNAGEKDYSAFVSKLKKAKVDALYYGGYHTELGLIMRQMAQQGLKIQVLSGDTMNTQEFWSITGNAGAGMMYTFAPDPRNQPQAKAIVAKFKEQGYDPEGYTLYTYAAFQVWADAVKKARTTDSEQVAKALKSGKFSTVIGDISFNAKGDRAVAGFTWFVFKEGSNNQVGDDPAPFIK